MDALTSGIQAPQSGDAYGVGKTEPYDIYIWDGATSSWVNNGRLQGAAGKNGTTFTPAVSQDGILSWTNDGGLANPDEVSIKGADGKNGTTFTPSVSQDGVLSWTNDGGLKNPDEVSIKGAVEWGFF